VPETGLLRIMAFLSLAASHRATRSVSSALNPQIRERAHTPETAILSNAAIPEVREAAFLLIARLEYAQFLALALP